MKQNLKKTLCNLLTIGAIAMPTIACTNLRLEEQLKPRNQIEKKVYIERNEYVSTKGHYSIPLDVSTNYLDSNQYLLESDQIEQGSNKMKEILRTNSLNNKWSFLVLPKNMEELIDKIGVGSDNFIKEFYENNKSERININVSWSKQIYSNKKQEFEFYKKNSVQFEGCELLKETDIQLGKEEGKKYNLRPEDKKDSILVLACHSDKRYQIVFKSTEGFNEKDILCDKVIKGFKFND
jgi:hypothetical protein